MFTLRINTDNSAFMNDESGELEPGREIARILREIAARAEGALSVNGAESWEMHLNDINGNKVGIARFED